MKLVPLHPLSSGLCAKVDDEDYDLVSRHRWSVLRKTKKAGYNTEYAVRNFQSVGWRSTVSMHGLVTGFRFDMVDHIDGDGTNNQKDNLRESTPSRNAMNKPRAAFRGVHTRFKGVAWRPETHRWQVSIARHPEIDAWRSGFSRQIKLGCYDIEEEAARARDAAVRVRWGPDQTYNYTRPGERSAVDGTVSPGDRALLTWGFDYIAENPGIDWGGQPPPPPPGSRWCGSCRDYRPVGEFGPNAGRPDGLQTYCRPCGRKAGIRSYHKTKAPLKGRRKAPAAVKLCNHCGLVGEFGANTKNKNGLMWCCKDCAARGTRAWRLKKAAKVSPPPCTA